MAHFKILSFDPGLSMSGWNLSKYDPNEKIMYIENCGMLFPNENLDLASNRATSIRYGLRIMTLNQLRDNLKCLMNQFHPDFVVSEDAFYNPSRPMAYCALVQWITMVSMVLYDEFQHTLFKLAPKIAKQVISGFGGAEKLGVQYAVTHKDDIKFNQNIDVKGLTEHTCDSIGIGYTFIQEILPSILDIWSNLNDEETQKIYRSQHQDDSDQS